MNKKPVFLLGLLAGIIVILAGALSRELWSPTARPPTPTAGTQLPATPGGPTPYSTPVFAPKQQAPQSPQYQPPPQNYPLVPIPATVEPTTGEAGMILETKKLSPSSKGSVFRFRVVSPARCMIGDLDIIREELKHSKKKSLRLSLEPLMGGKELAPRTAQISIGQLGRGVDQTFIIPNSKERVQLAVYICKDDDEDGRCGRKPAAPMERIFESYARSKGHTGVLGETGDKIYFFQYLILENDSVSIFNSEMTAIDYGNLVKYLSADRSTADDALMTVRKVRKLNSTIRSASIETHGSNLELVLPHVEDALCQMKGPQPLFKVPQKKKPAKPVIWKERLGR